MTDHPFPHDIISTVADEHEIEQSDLEQTLEQIQDAIERDGETYEYSSQHTFGWKDEAAFYLYGDGIWETLEDELSMGQQERTAARAVHRTHMLESARQRDEYETVVDQFDDGVSALVVTNTAEREPLFGQDV